MLTVIQKSVVANPEVEYIPQNRTVTIPPFVYLIQTHTLQTVG